MWHDITGLEVLQSVVAKEIYNMMCHISLFDISSKCYRMEEINLSVQFCLQLPRLHKGVKGLQASQFTGKGYLDRACKCESDCLESLEYILLECIILSDQKGICPPS